MDLNNRGDIKVYEHVSMYKQGNLIKTILCRMYNVRGCVASHSNVVQVKVKSDALVNGVKHPSNSGSLQ